MHTCVRMYVCTYVRMCLCFYMQYTKTVLRLEMFSSMLQPIHVHTLCMRQNLVQPPFIQ